MTGISLIADKLSEESIELLLTAARGGVAEERRADVRHPLFTAVNLRSRGTKQLLSAFSREISAGGVGLLHNMPLARGDVYELALAVGEVQLRRPAEIVWCRPAGEGWYLSGWRWIEA